MRVKAFLPPSETVVPVAVGATAFAATSLIVFLAVATGVALTNDAPAVPTTDPEVKGVFLNADGEHYLEIAREGYRYNPTGRSSVAFFPLFPLATRAVAATGLAIDTSLVLVANTLLFAAFIVLSIYARGRNGNSPLSAAGYAVVAFGNSRQHSSSHGLRGIVLLVPRGLGDAQHGTAMAALSGGRHRGVGNRQPPRRRGTRSGILAARLAAMPEVAWCLRSVDCSHANRAGRADRLHGLSGCRAGRPAGVCEDAGALEATRACVNRRQGNCTVVLRADMVGLRERFPGLLAAIGSSLSRCGEPRFGQPDLFSARGRAGNPWGVESLVELPRNAPGSAFLLLIPYITRSYEMCMLSQGRFMAVVFPIYLVMGHILSRIPGPYAAMVVGLSEFYFAVYTIHFAAGYPLI